LKAEEEEERNTPSVTAFTVKCNNFEATKYLA